MVPQVTTTEEDRKRFFSLYLRGGKKNVMNESKRKTWIMDVRYIEARHPFNRQEGAIRGDLLKSSFLWRAISTSLSLHTSYQDYEGNGWIDEETTEQFQIMEKNISSCIAE